MEKRGIIILGIAFSIIILGSFVYASLPSVPDIGSSSCVTYAQARATISSASGKTDAQLKSMGFCSGSEESTTPETTADSPTTTDTTSNTGDGDDEYGIPIPRIQDCSYEATNQYTVKGACALLNQGNQLEYLITREVISVRENYDLYRDVQKLQEDYGTDKSARWTEYELYEAEISKEYWDCLNNPGGDASYYDNCYDVTRSKGDKLKLDYYAADIKAAEETLQKIKDLKAQESAKEKSDITDSSEDQQNTNQGSNSFNTNSDRGRDEFGRMNPSIEGYLGDAYVVRSDGTKVIPGHELYLKVEDRVVSGKDSNINIIFSNAGKINLGHDTELKVGNALLDQFYLARGTLKSKISFTKTQKFEIDTPNAGIFIRGTEYVIDYNETTNTTIIYLNEGVLEINIKNKTTNLTSGNYLIIYANGTTKTNQLKSENWSNLDNNFYDTPDAKGFFKSFTIIIFIIDLVIIFILRLWMKNKIKNPNKKDKSTSKGTASLVLGILGIILLLAPYIGIILSAIGFFLSRIQKSNKPTGLATAGFVLGIIGLILNALFLFMSIFAS